MDDTNQTVAWRELFGSGNGLRIAVLVSGVGLHAMNVFISGTLMPSVAADIGGLEYFAWNTTLFILASIAASIFAAVRPFGMGPRLNFLLACLAFCLGSLLCGLAPHIWVMLVGRTVQGFGAGLLGALVYAMIRMVFPERLWTRAMGLLSLVWGVATLIGPAIGGIFAQFDAWRWAFLLLVPYALALAVVALRVVPARSDERGMQKVPLPQILLLMGAVLALSVASVVTINAAFTLLLIAVALAAMLWLGRLERRGPRRLLPAGSFSLKTSFAPLLLLMLLLQLSITSDVFVPLFLQSLHGQGPLVAGYMVALVAVGWSSGSVLCSGWTGDRSRMLLVAGPLLLSIGAIGMAVFMARSNPAGHLASLVPVGLSLLAMGLGIGASWPHLLTRVFQAAPRGERDLTSAAVNMVQLFGSGLGAAVGGVIVNFAGLSGATDIDDRLAPASWLFGLFALVPLAALPLAWSLRRKEAAQAVPRAA